MPLPFLPNCQPTSLGPLPYDDPAVAWDIVHRYTPGLPALPLLAGEGESPTLLGAEGFAGVEASNVEIRLDRAAAINSLTTLYAAYLRGTSATEAVELAALPKLQPIEQSPLRRARTLFGLVLGPISLSLTMIDDQAEPILNDAQLLDACAKHLFLRRSWLHTQLERTGKPAIVWVYEPCFNVLAWPFSPLPPDDVMAAADHTLGYGAPRALWLPNIETARALGDDWRVDLVGMPLPAPEQAEGARTLMSRLLADKTAIAWGIVPVTTEGVRSATVGRLAARFEAWLRALDAVGVPPAEVLAASLIMPEDTLAHLEPAEAERALALTAELSSIVRQSYGVD